MSIKKLFFVALTFLFFQQAIAQRNYAGYNLLGINGGVTLFDINTDDLVTKQKVGFTGGFTTRGAFYDNFDLIYGINYFNSKLAIEGKSEGVAQEIGYNIQGAQLNFLGSYNIVVQRLSVEFGPVLSVNSKMKLDDEKYKDYILTGYNTLRAKDIQDISTFNFHLAAGLTAGLEHFRVSAQYQYGITNMLNKLNNQDLGKTDFKGHSSTIILAAVVYF